MVTEKELIKRCCKNDPRAQQELYEKYAPKMYGVCLRYACNKEIAQDLMHDGFITVFSKISSFRGEGSFEGWLRRIFVNTALGYLRKTDIVGHAAEIETAGQFGSAEATAVEQMTEAERLRCIAKLPDGYRAVLNLFAIEGYSHKEIAAMLNISEGTSRSQYLRAKVFLQRLLQKEEII